MNEKEGLVVVQLLTSRLRLLLAPLLTLDDFFVFSSEKPEMDFSVHEVQ